MVSISYDSDENEYVVKFKEYIKNSFGDLAQATILSPKEFKEVGLPSFESMKYLMDPSERRGFTFARSLILIVLGSIYRRIARVTAEQKHYFLIKAVRDLQHGANEVVCLHFRS